MALLDSATSPLRHADRFFIGGEWVVPTSDATIEVIDSGTEEHFFSVAEAQESDMDRAVAAARAAFDDGPMAPDDPRPAGGVPAGPGGRTGGPGRRHRPRSGRASPACSTRSRTRRPSDAAGTFDFYAGLADTFEWDGTASPAVPGSGCW